MSDWNPTQYTKFERERTRPSQDLIRQLPHTPHTILDIGCGPGNSTAQLQEAFPHAHIVGIDSSEAMLEKARLTHPALSFQSCVVPDELDKLGKFDLVFSNACLHWIPDHARLLPSILTKSVQAGGCLAVQMPMVQTAPFYQILGAVIQEKRWEKLQAVQNFHNLSPNQTYDVLTTCAREIDMWETVYYHVVPDHHAVLEWYKGSGLRTYLDRLEEAERADFLTELLSRVQAAMPTAADNTVLLKMPRLFFIAYK